jgi:CBS domain containing-hemolysin-like protein
MISLEFLFLVVLFLSAAYFSAAEIAMTALNRFKIAELAEQHPSNAKILERWQHNPSRLLTTIIVCSNLTVVAFSSIATLFSFNLSPAGSSLSQAVASSLAIALSVLVVLLAEIAPKLLAKRHPERVALLVLPGLRLVEFLLGPVIRMLVGLIRALLQPFGGAEGSGLPVVTEEELVRMVDEGARDGVIEKEESEMIQSIIEFGDTVVREVMIPRTEVMGVPLGASVDECHDLFIDSGYSRLPVYEENLDGIKGILYAKDFLSMLKDRELIILHDVIRPAFFVPETKKVSDLLREFKKGKVHIAIVVDEYGGTSGLVTLEDLVEEIVGEIRDEFDLENPPIRKTAENSWDVDGSAELHLLSTELGLELPEGLESTTTAGWVTEMARGIPKLGQKLSYENFEIEVTQANERRVDKIRMRRAGR